MRGTLKSGARKVQRTGLIDERHEWGDEDLDEDRENREQGREKWSAGWFANSIIPRRISPSLSLPLTPLLGSFHGLFPIFPRVCRKDIWGVHVCTHICAHIFLRGVIARNKKDDLRLFLHRESWSSPSALCVQIASHSDKSAFDTLLPVEDNFLFIPKMRCRKATIRASSSETRNCPWYKRHDLISLADIEMTILNYGPDFWQDVDRITRFNSTKWTWN